MIVKKLKLALWPLGVIYGSIVALRNLFFDWDWLKSEKVKTPTISVGNLTTGGTGKTPHVDYLINVLKNKYNTAVLMRGYGRETKGYIILSENASVETVGDEALFYKKKHKNDVAVAVCEKRVHGAKQLEKQYKKLEAILLDDAFQHRYIKRDLDILLIDYNNPFWKDTLLPAGNLREFSCGKNRADIIIVSKCPLEIKIDEKEQIAQKIKPKATQQLFFSSLKYGSINGFNDEPFNLPKKILLVTGIANPLPLKSHLNKIAPVEHLVFDDHHRFNHSDIRKIHELFDTFVESEKVIITTEKDFMRLQQPAFSSEISRYPWFFQKITVSLDKEKMFNELIEKHVKTI